MYGFILSVSHSSLSIKLSSFISSTTGYFNTSCDGGAVNFDGLHKTFIIELTSFINNSANAISSLGSARGRGGAVYYASGSELRISSSTFSGNTATLSGGALYIYGKPVAIEILNSSFSFNSAGRYAGSLYYYYYTCLMVVF